MLLGSITAALLGIGWGVIYAGGLRRQAKA
ncbi:hypothetical protein KL86PLE_40371 [uncultured Pleomorphomonas sp.]|uniref:Uncharacterized protein n=1 Tax=uncultured Pleomorphomonas sp. TaxID=442121 RepID=A0A212LG72_9HYPH|nr:hypothetical protein KL86PLE_40371 [uncultured Pleomorphomonas sp.]